MFSTQCAITDSVELYTYTLFRTYHFKQKHNCTEIEYLTKYVPCKF